MVIFLNDLLFNQLDLGINKIHLDKDLLHYFKNVLRLEKKSKIIINSENNTINNYTYFIGELENYFSNYLELNLIHKETVNNSFPLIDVFIVPLKSRYFQTAIENLTQLPINSINLIKSKFIATNFQEIAHKTKKIEKIIYWNSIYVKKYYLPKLNVIQNKTIEDLRDILKKYPQVIVYDHQTEERINLKSKYYDSIAVMIGPEGGWAEEEIQKLKTFDNLSVFRFKNIDTAVKAEVAVVIGISQLLSYLEI